MELINVHVRLLFNFQIVNPRSSDTVVCEESSPGEVLMSLGQDKTNVVSPDSEGSIEHWTLRFCRVLWRFCGLTVIFAPLAILSPVYVTFWWFEPVRSLFYSQLLTALQRGGPTFIKLAQWAACRRDLFPAQLCQQLSLLHSSIFEVTKLNVLNTCNFMQV